MNGILIAAAFVGLVTAFGAGYRVASNAADSRELVAQQAAQERYHSKEVDYNTAAVNLEQARAALAAQRAATSRKVAEIASRPSYQRDCLDADGVRAFNDAIGTPTADTAKPYR